MHQQLLINAERRDLRSGRFRRRVGLVDVAGGENVDAHDLELRGGSRSREHRPAIAGDGGGENLALIEQRRDESEDWPRCSVHSPTAKMSRVRRLHVVVDNDAAIDFETGRAAEIRVGPDARRDHDEIGFDALAVDELRGLRRGRCRAELAVCLAAAARGCRGSSILRVRDTSPPVGSS